MIHPFIPLVLWPLVTAWMVLKLGWPRAVVLSITLGYLFLPEDIGIDLPVLPAFDKNSIPALTLLAMGLVLAAPAAGPRGAAPPVQDGPATILPGWLPRNVIGVLLLAAIVGGAFFTALTNRGRLIYGETVLPGMSVYDGFSLTLTALMTILPFLLGRRYLAHPDQHRLLLGVFVACMAVYTLPTLFEARMSPQLNIHVYGYRQYSWHMVSRGGGWRPTVFTHHGLVLGILFCMAAIASIGLVRLTPPAKRGLAIALALWLFLTLALINSLGAFLIALVLIPVVVFSKLRLQLLVAAGLAGTVLIYPVLRGADLVPTGAVLELAGAIDADRAQSFEFRLDNEDLLLERANRRPVFGWGGYSRNRVYDEQGNRITVTDGAWIIAIGQGGWVNYIGRFGLLTLPILLMAVRRRRIEPAPETALLGLVLLANVVDLVPNAGQTSISWMMAGALMGRLELGRLGAPVAAAAATAPAVIRPGYVRGGPEPAPPDPVPGRAPTYTRQPIRHTRRLRDAE